MKGTMLPLLSNFVLALAVMAAPPQIPQQPAVMPEFSVPRDNASTLDDHWIYVQTLYDAVNTRPDLWGAVPVGMDFTHNGRGFIAVLHTVFRTLDAGRNWANLDPQPPPAPSPAFAPLRTPNFLNDLFIRPIARTELSLDTVYLAGFNAVNTRGFVKSLRGSSSQHVLWPGDLLAANRWITAVIAPDSQTAVALAGLDAKIFRNDSMLTSTTWDTLPYQFNDTWVGNATTAGNFIYAVGSHRWLSFDRGFSWQVLPPADPQGDLDLDFAPQSGRAIVCGGNVAAQTGWVRYTTDFGQTWSARTLETNVPLRSVLLLNDSLGYAAGGDVARAIGQVWKTTDGGATWTLDLEADAEFRELGSVRESGAYVNVMAAGYYADLRGAVWRAPVFLPSGNGAALYADPDRLEFATVAGGNDTETVILRNAGSAQISVTDVFALPPFSASCCQTDMLLLPGDTLAMTVTFAPDTSGVYEREVRVLNDQNQVVSIYCTGQADASSADPRAPLLPEELSLSVWPNPGNAEFRVSYSLTRTADVQLRMFDVTGREMDRLINERREAGEHVLTWNARRFSSGIYFIALHTGGTVKTLKVALIK